MDEHCLSLVGLCKGLSPPENKANQSRITYSQGFKVAGCRSGSCLPMLTRPVTTQLSTSLPSACTPSPAPAQGLLFIHAPL